MIMFSYYLRHSHFFLLTKRHSHYQSTKEITRPVNLIQLIATLPSICSGFSSNFGNSTN